LYDDCGVIQTCVAVGWIESVHADLIQTSLLKRRVGWCREFLDESNLYYRTGVRFC
jgi:hypothetical protein